MEYGICELGVISMRIEPSDKSELVSQVLFGEYFKVSKKKKNWVKIKLSADKYEGWIDSKQYSEIDKEYYDNLKNSEARYSSNLIDFIRDPEDNIIILPFGSHLPLIDTDTNIFKINDNQYKYEEPTILSEKSKKNIVKTAMLYLKAPYLWGGKTPLGIDCSGFVQMVYKLNGYDLPRDASMQAMKGKVLGFIQEAKPGDLVFFDNDEGEVIHVGIMLEDGLVIHAHGQVRIDQIDNYGIYNSDTKKHTHKIRVLKRL
ncbi:MAG: C40 family peptidase [Flavobacteriaceae bacterium]|nr:C40 family peptidase [Flavobacteriaceae bacterium]